jgi:hypothetical protein
LKEKYRGSVAGVEFGFYKRLRGLLNGCEKCDGDIYPS